MATIGCIINLNQWATLGMPRGINAPILQWDGYKAKG